MAITADEIATALNVAGVDTVAELDAWAKSLNNKGPELEKIDNKLNRLNKRFQADVNARQARRDELGALLEDAQRELEAGSDPTGDVPSFPEIDEVAPATPFTPAP